MEQKQKGSKQKLIIAAVALVVLIGAGVGLGIWLMSPKAPDAAPAATQMVNGRGIVAVPENIDELMAKRGEPVPYGYYTSRMNTDWVFDTADVPSKNAYVENATNNTATVYFDLILVDTNQTIYSSPYIPVGGKLDNITLDVTLPAGEYTPIVVYHLVDEQYNELSTLSIAITLRILG